jgi:BirA family biotin operon repressor/biotin-[acetyl-CoA-carboxylase] ligase
LSSSSDVPATGPRPEHFDAPPLATSALQRWLADAGMTAPTDVEVVGSTGSTNDDLLERARLRRPARPIVRAADEQTSGRGRHRRPWKARSRSALLFSVAVPLESLPAALPAVTLACGVALADRLIARGVPVTLKWPNDLLLEGRKLAGVLCELAVDGDGHATLVVGIGVNGWLTDADRTAIGGPAACLAEVVPSSLLALEREAWIAQLAHAILSSVIRYMEEGFVPVRQRYNELMDARGQSVDIVDEGRVLASGRAVEVDTIGRLMLATAGGLRGINVGDVSLRRTSSDDAAG